MRKRTMTVLPLALLAATSVAYGQDAEKVNSPTAIHQKSMQHMEAVQKTLGTLGTPETPFDYIAPIVSGPTVILEGFTINGALKDNADAQVKKLPWVKNVLNEVVLINSMGPEMRRGRQQALGILKEMVPQAFGANQADIRIKITEKGDVTLIGVVEKDDKKRLEAAVEQIKHITFVGTVTDDVVVSTE